MSVSRETKFDAYLALLQRWGRTLNLTSAQKNTEKGLRDLIEDSLTVISYLPGDLDRLIDLGSGQGFPAIPIAIATDISIDMIESDKRKAAFLTTALAQLGLRGSVWPTRIEQAAVLPARCVTAKALAPLPNLITWAKPLLSQDGFCLFLKGPAAQEELPIGYASEHLHIEYLPTSRPSSTIVKVRSLS